MKKTQAQPKLLKELEKTPIMSVACEKVSISRQTAYRWMKEDESFLEKVQEAMNHGVGLVNDVAESNILRGIKQGDKGDTKYWLSHRHEAFKKPFQHRTGSMDIIQLKRVADALRANISKDPFAEERKKQKVEKARKMLDMWCRPDKKSKKKPTS